MDSIKNDILNNEVFFFAMSFLFFLFLLLLFFYFTILDSVGEGGGDDLGEWH